MQMHTYLHPSADYSRPLPSAVEDVTNVHSVHLIIIKETK